VARYMRTDLGRGHTNLGKPVVVNAPPLARPLQVELAPSHRLSRRAQSQLLPPAVIGAGKVNPGLRVKLTFGQRRPGRALLRPPAVVTAAFVFIAEPVRVTLAPSATQARRAHSRLGPPTVIAGAIAWHGPGIYLTRERRPVTKSALRAPAVVTPAVVQVFFGPSVTLAPSTRPKAQSQLLPPAVIGGARVNPGLRIKLVFGQTRRGVANLFPPAVVTAAVTEAFFGPPPTFAPQRRGRATYDLAAPIVLDSGGALGWLAVSLAPQRRGITKSILRPPAVVTAAVVQVYYGPEVTLVRRRTPRTTRFLRPPVIPPLARPLEVALAPQRRGAPHSVLAPPRVVFLAVEIYGPETTLVRIKPVPTISVLRAPVVVAVVAYYGPQVNLTYSRRLVAKSVLRPPAVVGAGRVNPALRIKLTFGRRGVTRSFLRPPVAPVVAVVVYFGPQVTLTRIRPRRTLALLQPPAVISPDVAFDGPGILLTRSFRGRPRSFLRKPVVVAPVVSYGPQQWLTYSRRGRPQSDLRPPRVVAAAPARAEVQPPWLTYSRRGRPRSILRKPTRVFPFFARKTDITLAPQRRGQPTSFLRPPAILRTRGTVSINLTYSRRGRPKSILRGPRVVRLAVEIYGPETWLTYSRRGRPQYRLEPPTVTARTPFRGLLTHLTYSRRGRPISFRIPFEPGKAPFRPILVSLTTITPPPVLSLLKPPSVVGAGIAFFGPSVTLVRIKPPPVMYVLRLTLVAFRRPGGDVCGFDIAGSFVCSLELPGSQVIGSERAGAQVTGSSRAATKITGSENAGGSVSGSDRKAT
jgi:hypothetical protein